MKVPTKIVLIRHGETAWNQEGRVQGLTDTSLNDTGVRQAESLALALKEERLNAIYSSPLRRALDTARVIAEQHGLQVQVEDDLREMDVGDMDGLTYKELRERYADFMKEWSENVSTLKMPGGEHISELQERAWQTIQDIVSKHPGATVAVVSHNFVIQSIICKALDLTLTNFRRLRQDLASMSVLEFGERGPVLLSLNERCYWTRSHLPKRE